MHRNKLAIVAAIGAVLLGSLTTGCSEAADKLDPTGDPAAATTEHSMLKVNQWGVVDGLLSVLVVNTSDRTLRYGEGVIRAVDADGKLVASSLDRGDAGCCTLVDLPAEDGYGIYLDVGAAAARIKDVTVSYRNVSWAPAGATPSLRDVTVKPIGIDEGPSGAVAVAEVTSKKKHAQIGVQAFLLDADGKLVAVISGRWTCLGTGPRQVRLQLFHPVPEGTTLGQVRVHSIDDLPTGRPPACDGSDQR